MKYIITITNKHSRQVEEVTLYAASLRELLDWITQSEYEPDDSIDTLQDVEDAANDWLNDHNIKIKAALV